MPVISVIIAAYGRSEMLKLAVQSALQQSFHDLEVIVVCDGCEVSARAIRENFDDPRLRVVNLNRNTGDQSGPNNVGGVFAQGQYLAFLNQDDLWCENHLALCHDWLLARQADLVFSLAAGIPHDFDPAHPPHPTHFCGLGPSRYDPVEQYIPASSWFLTCALFEDMGGWRAAHELIEESSQNFLWRAHRAKKRILQMPEVTVFHCASGLQDNAYRQLGPGPLAILMNHLAQPEPLLLSLLPLEEETLQTISRARRSLLLPLRWLAYQIRAALKRQLQPFGEANWIKLLLRIAARFGVAPQVIRYRVFIGERYGTYIARLRARRGLEKNDQHFVTRQSLRATLEKKCEALATLSQDENTNKVISLRCG